MNMFIDRQLAQIKYQEMLQEAAEARAYRKAQIAHPNPVTRKLRFILVTTLPVALWILWVFGSG
jgi:hypothetical protein